jgi:two-component system, NtrC family, response regulator PilR
MRKFAASHGKQVEEISSDALLRLLSYSYPGNVRELENVLEHAVAVANRNILTEDELPSHLKIAPVVENQPDDHSGGATQGSEDFFSKGVSLDAEMEAQERVIIVSALKRANGVQKRAAELLGINYRSLRHRLDKYNLLGKSQNSLEGGNPTEVAKYVTGIGDEL